MTCSSCGADMEARTGGMVCPECGWMQFSALDIRRAEALFVSGLDPVEHPSGADVRDAVRVELVVGDYAARMAQAYGDDQMLAARRMLWCRRMVREAFEAVPA